uniref:Uncharacterized protein n=1 Tax=Globodera rostochiensis TaxID=31243 RepID=A0A914HS09_GLORO
MGVSAIKSHVENKFHKQIEEEKRRNATIENFVRDKSTSSTLDMQIAAAEGTWAYHVANHHHSFASADCASSLFNGIFPDSHIAKRYGSARDKTRAIIKGVLSPLSMKVLKEELGQHQNFKKFGNF